MSQQNAHTSKSMPLFINPYAFARFMADYPFLCVEFLERFLSLNIADFSMKSPKDSLGRSGKSVSCRIQPENDDRFFEVEMMVCRQEDLEAGISYQEVISWCEISKMGDLRNEFPWKIMILICPFDPVGIDVTRTSFSRYCSKDGSVELAHAPSILYINTTIIDEELPEELKALLRYMQDGTIVEDNSFVKELNDVVYGAFGPDWAYAPDSMNKDLTFTRTQFRESRSKSKAKSPDSGE